MREICEKATPVIGQRTVELDADLVARLLDVVEAAKGTYCHDCDCCETEEELDDMCSCGWFYVRETLAALEEET